MLDYPCGWSGCTDRSCLNCQLCFRHLCPKHYLDERHVRSGVDPLGQENRQLEIARFQEIINELGIVEHALKLRPHGLSITPPNLKVEDLPAGRINSHVLLEWSDGVKWIARIRKPGFKALPSIIERPYTQGEIDVMHYFERCGMSSIPRVKSPIYTNGNTIFYFMEMLSGFSGRDPPWADNKPRDQVSRMILDFAKINIQRSLHSLKGVGSMHHDESSDTFFVGPMYTPYIANTDPPIFPGPWSTAAGKYEWEFNYFLDGIQSGELFSWNRENAFIIFSWMKDVVMAYPPYNVEEPFFVIHEDSNGGHIMIDEEGHITGLIDWERASVGPKCEAFASPQAFEEELFNAGSNELSWAELELDAAYRSLGRPDLAECIKLGKPFQWLSILIGGGEWDVYKYLKALGISMGLEMKETMEEFIEEKRERYIGGLRELVWDTDPENGGEDNETGVLGSAENE